MRGLITGKGIFTGSIEAQAGKFYYTGGGIPASIAYVTKVSDDYVQYILIRDRLYHSEPTERREQRWIFENGAARALQNMKDQPSFADEVTAVLNGTLDVPEYTTLEQSRINSTKAAEQAAAIRAKTTEYSAKETAALVRPILKKNFPGVKFSVRTTRSTYNYNVDVGWTDGPTTKAVEALIGHMKAGSFDGMIDLYTSSGPQKQSDGSYVEYHNHYMGCNRSYSIDGFTHLRNLVCEKFGLNADDFPVLVYESGSPYIKRGQLSSEHDVDVRIWRMGQETDLQTQQEEKPEPVESAPGSEVVYGEYKGHQTIGIKAGERTTWIGAKNKVEAILSNVEALQAWLAEQE